MSRAKYTRNLKITRLCILQFNFQLCVSQSRSVSLSEVCGHFQDPIQNNWVWQAFDLISPGPCTWLMYTGALHCTWITVCSFGACKEHRYLLFCMVKVEGQSQLRAVAAALQLLSKSCQWSLRRAAGLHPPPPLPSTPGLWTQVPRVPCGLCRTWGPELCSDFSILHKVADAKDGSGGRRRWQMLPRTKTWPHTSWAWLVRILDPGCQVWRDFSWFLRMILCLSPSIHKFRKIVGYQSLSLPEVFSWPWAYKYLHYVTPA